MVRLYRTFSICIVIGETRCAGCLCTSLGWFKHTEPLRTFLNYILTEIARYIEFFYTSSGWFDWTEPSLTTSLQRIEGVQGAICTSLMRFKHIEPLLELHPYRILHKFGVVRLYRTFSIYISSRMVVEY